MSGKLDQSLDSIVAARRKVNRPRRGLRKSTGAKPVATPVGGVKKAIKPVKKGEKPSAPAAVARGEGKVMISNLPSDVKEGQIKEYFGNTIGQVKRVLLVYGPQGQSRGIANVTFWKSESATKAVQELNGVKVDGRPMKVEVIVDAQNAPALTQPKKLADRIVQPKNAAKPKPATDVKPKGQSEGAKAGRGRNRAGRAPRPGRGKKTAEDLDAEMVDYFNEAPAPSGGAVQATTGDAMEADVL